MHVQAHKNEYESAGTIRSDTPTTLHSLYFKSDIVKLIPTHQHISSISSFCFVEQRFNQCLSVRAQLPGNCSEHSSPPAHNGQDMQSFANPTTPSTQTRVLAASNYKEITHMYEFHLKDNCLCNPPRVLLTPLLAGLKPGWEAGALTRKLKTAVSGLSR